MTYQEMTTYGMIAFTFILMLIRLFGFKQGKVLKRYAVGSSMTIGNRQVQEDKVGICQSAYGLLAVLADGMGKNYGGKIASRIAVDTIKQIFKEYRSFVNPTYFFKKAFHAANQEIQKELDGRSGCASAAAAVLQDNKLYYALAGNIKIGVFRGGNLIPVTSGHTIDRLAEDGYMQGTLTREEAAAFLHKRRVYNYLGQDAFHELEYFDAPVLLKRGDIVALMSDGVYEGMTWKEIEECLRMKKKCQEKAFDIIERINVSSKKQKDNASIILVEQP